MPSGTDQPRHCRWPSFSGPSEPREPTLLLTHPSSQVSLVTHVTCFRPCCTFFGPCCFCPPLFWNFFLSVFWSPLEHTSPTPAQHTRVHTHTHTHTHAPSSFSFLCAQSCLTPCDPMDCGPPGSSVHEISRQEYWRGVPFPPPGHLLTQGLNLCLLHWQAGSLPRSHLGSPFSLNPTQNLLLLEIRAPPPPPPRGWIPCSPRWEILTALTLSSDHPVNVFLILNYLSICLYVFLKFTFSWKTSRQELFVQTSCLVYSVQPSCMNILGDQLLCKSTFNLNSAFPITVERPAPWEGQNPLHYNGFANPAV